jgi:crotonobetainyl-CoA:carnitine CoA-transferase CaiB-like acyl-CoA transferase
VSPLSGVRVLELAALGPVSFTGMMLADLGADVVRVEPPGGGRLRHLPPRGLGAAYFDTNKRSIVADLGTEQGRARLARLAARADVVVDTGPPGHLDDLGAGPAVLCAANPALVWVAVTPFGLTGPRRHWRASNLTAWAQSGVLRTTGEPDRPPVVPGGPVRLAQVLASFNAAIGALLAVRARRRTGRGQVVDVSVVESAMLAGIEVGVPYWVDDLVPRERQGNRRAAIRPWGLYPCADGWASLVSVVPEHWDALGAWIHERTGNEAATEPVFREVLTRVEAAELVDEWTSELTVTYAKHELFAEAQRRGIPCTPVNTVADLAGDPHLAARGFWVEVDDPELGTVRLPGAPYRLSATPWRAGRAPRLGEHDADADLA